MMMMMMMMMTFSSLGSSVLEPVGINLNLFYQQYNNFIKFKKDLFVRDDGLPYEGTEEERRRRNRESSIS